ncbi:hypothetical protein ABPG77_007432 [Micractinium sp. CCAP 211/92]
MVLVRFRQSPRAAAAAAAQASRPLPGLELKRLVGKHQDVHVGRDFEHASGHGSLQRALSQSEPLPSDALMLFGITDGSSVPAKVAQLKGHTDVEFVEPNFKFRLAQRAIPLNMERATATGDLMSEGASGEAAVDKAAGGCSNATGACNGDGGNSSIFETRPHDSYWWDSFGRTLYHLDRVWAPKAWDTTTGSKQVKVCVIDSGVRRTHEDLAANIAGGWNRALNLTSWTMPAPGSDDYNNYEDSHGHGTHCAGIIGAVGNNWRGTSGVVWNVSMYMCKAMASDQGLYSSSTLDCYSRCSEARAAGAKVVSASYGGYSYSQSQNNAIASLGAAGILFVSAAGNDNTNVENNQTYPAMYGNANQIAVAASDMNLYDSKASFSNYAATRVHIAAPGVNILSTYKDSDTSYALMSGTSMATPVTAGAAALLFAAKPNATMAEVRSALLSSVDTKPALAGVCSSGGRLNVAKAAATLLGQPTPTYTRQFTYLSNTFWNSWSYYPGTYGTMTDMTNETSNAACKARCQATSWCYFSAAQPPGSTATSLAAATQPIPAAAQPFPTSSQPISPITKPIATTLKPNPATSKPVVTTPQPQPAAPQAVSTSAQPISAAPKAGSTSSLAVSPTPQPISTFAHTKLTSSQPRTPAD